MKSSSYAIMMAAVIFAAAFAGLALVADDALAADGESEESTSTETWTDDGKGDYTVTFAFDGGVIVKTMASKNTYLFTKDVVGSINNTVKVPTGYAFSAWKDTSSGVVYDSTSAYTFTQDIIVEPVFKADRAIVQLTYVTVDGETITVECMNNKSADEKITISDENEKKKVEITRAYSVSDGDLEKFAEAIGAKVVEETSTDSTNKTITGFKLDGYEFKGFVKATDTDANLITKFSELIANAKYTITTNTTGGDESSTTATLKSVEVVEYIAVFEPIYDVVFYINDTAVLSTTSNMVIVNGEVVKVPDAPTKDNYIFMGWYDILGEKVIGYSVDTTKHTLVDKDFEFTEDTALFAEFVPLTFTVTFVYGEDQEVFITETVKYGEKAIEPNGLPAGYKGWDFDFSEAIVEDTVIEAIVADPVTIYNVTFEIEGKTPVTQKSDSLVVPDTAIDGKVFKGWVVKGQTQYVDPAKYDITQDVTFVAIYDKAPAPAGPGFFQTTTGQCTIVILVVLILAFIYAVHTNMWGLKDFLASFKLQRVKKE